MTQSIRSRDVLETGSRRRRDLTPPPEPDPLPLPVPDNHVHLDIADGADIAGTDIDGADTDGADTAEADAGADAADAGRVARLLAAAARSNVVNAVQIGCDLPGARWTRRLLDERSDLLGGVAIHPNEAPRIVADAGGAALDEAIDQIDALLDHPAMRVVGETGLDHFRTPPEGRGAQEHSFRRHIDIAKRRGLALQIHDRDAHEDVIAIVSDEGAPERTVFHCFSGDAEMARTCARNGWFMSFAGVVTFSNAEPLRQALRQVPRELLLVETDAPFLTPHPFRGRPNASYLIPLTVRAMAEIRGDDLGDLCEALATNTTTVYGEWMNT